MTRRRFLSTTSQTTAAVALAGAAIPVRSLLALQAYDNYRESIGVQLYTLRKEIKADATGTIQAVVDAGYKQGEMYGFPDCQPMIDAAKAAGLQLHSSHFNWDVVTAPKDDGFSDFRKTVERATEVGLKHLVVPYLHAHERNGADGYRKLCENLNQAAEISKEAGIQLAYHNHAFEFQPQGKEKDAPTGYSIMIDEFSENMKFEVDVFWVKVAEKDPAALIKKLGKRVSQLHLKDLAADTKLGAFGIPPKEAFQELGDGSIPMEPIITAAAAAEVEHCHVEQDHSPDPLGSIRQSMAYLQKL